MGIFVNLIAMKAFILMCLVAVAVVEAAPEASPEALASPFFFDLFKRCDCRNYYTKKCEQKSEQECETIYKDSCKQVYVEECEADKKQKCETKYKEVCVDEKKQKCETSYKDECTTEKKQVCETTLPRSANQLTIMKRNVRKSLMKVVTMLKFHTVRKCHKNTVLTTLCLNVIRNPNKNATIILYPNVTKNPNKNATTLM